MATTRQTLSMPAINGEFLAIENDIDELVRRLVDAGKLVLFVPFCPDEFMTNVDGLAFLTGRAVSTVRNWQDNGRAPPAIRYDGRLYFPLKTIFG